MDTVKKIFSAITLSCLFLLPCISYAEEKSDAYFVVEAGMLGKGNFENIAKQEIIKEKPEAKNMKMKSGSAFLVRFAGNMPYSLFNARYGIAIDGGGTPSMEFSAKYYSWSSAYYSQTFGDGMILRFMFTNEYFVIGSAKEGRGLAIYTGAGFSGLYEMQLGEDTLLDTKDYSGISYDYGLKCYIRFAPDFSATIGAVKSVIIKTGGFSWKTEHIFVGTAVKF